MPHQVKPILAGRQKKPSLLGVFRDSFRHILILKPVIAAIMFYAPPPPAPAKHREVQVSVFGSVLKWTTLHRVLKEEEVDFKGVCCSYGNYFCGGGIVLRLCNPLFNVI